MPSAFNCSSYVLRGAVATAQYQVEGASFPASGTICTVPGDKMPETLPSTIPDEAIDLRLKQLPLLNLQLGHTLVHLPDSVCLKGGEGGLACYHFQEIAQA